MPDLENDMRLDPRVKWALRNVPVTNLTDVDSRETLLEISNHPKAVAIREKGAALYDSLDTEDVASSAGLSITVHEFTSTPDGNTVKIRYVRPEGDDVVPCVYYIHGGGMQNGSAFEATLPDLGQGARGRGSRGRHGRLPQRGHGVVGARGRAVPCRVARLRVGPAMGRGERRGAAHRPGTGDRRRRERRRQSDAGHRHDAAARRRHRADQGPVCAVPVHRRTVAAGAVPVVDRERGLPAEPAPQSWRDGVRHRALRGGQPARLAVARHRGRRQRAARRRSSASTKPTRCATRASTSTACCCEPVSPPSAAS